MTRAVIVAVTACLLAALFETLCAGKGVRQRMASLRSPSCSIPFRGWIAIGGMYYAICFIVLTRLLLLPSPRPILAIGLLTCVMILNALWNAFFFRRRNLRGAFLLSFGYSAIAAALLVVLLKRDVISALWFVPYVVYLLYANAWGYQIWQLNRRSNA